MDALAKRAGHDDGAIVRGALMRDSPVFRQGKFEFAPFHAPQFGADEIAQIADHHQAVTVT